MQILVASEILEIEKELGQQLPKLYIDILTRYGFGISDEKTEIYHPREVRELYESFFDDPRQLFHPYFPFGCNNRTQVIWIIDNSTGKTAVIWHETVPDDWPEEDWLSPEDWLVRYWPVKL